MDCTSLYALAEQAVEPLKGYIIEWELDYQRAKAQGYDKAEVYNRGAALCGHAASRINKACKEAGFDLEDTLEEPMAGAIRLVVHVPMMEKVCDMLLEEAAYYEAGNHKRRCRWYGTGDRVDGSYLTISGE